MGNQRRKKAKKHNIKRLTIFLIVLHKTQVVVCSKTADHDIFTHFASEFC